MKKVIILAVVFLITASLSAGYRYTEDSRSTAMGKTEFSAIPDYINYFRNPATLYLHRGSAYSFVSGLALSDSFIGGAEGRLSKDPDSCIKAQFIGDNMSVGLSLDYDIRNQIPQTGYYTADSVREFELDVCVGGGISYFSGGIGVHFVSPWIRSGFRVDDTEWIQDIFRECYASSYERYTSESSADLRAGFLLNYENYSLGIIFENIATYNNSETMFSLEQLKNGISFSFAYNPDFFSKRGRLVPVVYSFVIDGQHILDMENGSINAGVELIWQLVRKHSVSLRVGYNSKISELPSGNIAAGVGLRLGDYDIGIDASVPTGVLAGDVNQKYTIGVTFTMLR